MWRQESRVGELGARQRVVRAIESQLVQFQILNIQRNGRMLEQTIPEHFSRLREARIPTNEDAKHGLKLRKVSVCLSFYVSGCLGGCVSDSQAPRYSDT